jgi:hypothetical protein
VDIVCESCELCIMLVSAGSIIESVIDHLAIKPLFVTDLTFDCPGGCIF